MAGGQALPQLGAVASTASAPGVVRAAVTSRAPIGTIDSARTSAGAIVVRGWALDPDTGASIAVHLYVDGGLYGATSADLTRRDVGTVYGLGDDHGFAATIPATAGAHTVCAYGIDTNGGANALLSCRTVATKAPIGAIDSAWSSGGALVVRGWAVAPDTTDRVTVHFYVDGRWGAATTTSVWRPDVRAEILAGGSYSGYSVSIPASQGPHTVCAYGIDTDGGTNALLACQAVANRALIGAVDSVGESADSVVLRGWALGLDPAAPIIVHFYLDGRWGTATTADRERADVGAAYGLGDNHGFIVSIPAGVGTHTVCAYGVDTGGTHPLLGCRTVTGVDTVVSRLVLAPAAGAVPAGGAQAYAAEGFDAHGNELGDVASTTAFALDGARSGCSGATCSSAVPGGHTVTGTIGAVTGTASLSMNTVGVTGHDAFAWGQNELGETGTGLVSDYSAQVAVRADTDVHWASVAAGADYTVAIRADGTLWAWGNDFPGQPGGTPRAVPVRIGTDANWAAVAAGGSHAAAVKTDGTLWAWGTNENGELGDGTLGWRYAPVQVGVDTRWASVAAGASHTVAVKIDGTLWAWGDDTFGELGHGTASDARGLVPGQVGTDTHWSTVAAGGDFTVAVRTDGTLWAWGRNDVGQVGDGTTAARSAPVRVGGDTSWASVAAGASHSVAVKTDGTLWAWGHNSEGELGDGSGIDRWAPVQVGTGTHWASSASGDQYTMAIETDGTLWAWGANGCGQLGDGTLVHRLAPQRVGSDAHWIAVAAGSGHAIALRSRTAPAA